MYSWHIAVNDSTGVVCSIMQWLFQARSCPCVRVQLHKLAQQEVLRLSSLVYCLQTLGICQYAVALLEWSVNG